jgi:hypothetical protein
MVPSSLPAAWLPRPSRFWGPETLTTPRQPQRRHQPPAETLSHARHQPLAVTVHLSHGFAGRSVGQIGEVARYLRRRARALPHEAGPRAGVAAPPDPRGAGDARHSPARPYPGSSGRLSGGLSRTHRDRVGASRRYGWTWGVASGPDYSSLSRGAPASAVGGFVAPGYCGPGGARVPLAGGTYVR